MYWELYTPIKMYTDNSCYKDYLLIIRWLFDFTSQLTPLWYFSFVIISIIMSITMQQQLLISIFQCIWKMNNQSMWSFMCISAFHLQCFNFKVKARKKETYIGCKFLNCFYHTFFQNGSYSIFSGHPFYLPSLTKTCFSSEDTASYVGFSKDSCLSICFPIFTKPYCITDIQ